MRVRPSFIQRQPDTGENLKTVLWIEERVSGGEKQLGLQESADRWSEAKSSSGQEDRGMCVSWATWASFSISACVPWDSSAWSGLGTVSGTKHTIFLSFVVVVAAVLKCSQGVQSSRVPAFHVFRAGSQG